MNDETITAAALAEGMTLLKPPNMRTCTLGSVGADTPLWRRQTMWPGACNSTAASPPEIRDNAGYIRLG
jgi:hypothetical protein